MICLEKYTNTGRLYFLRSKITFSLGIYIESNFDDLEIKIGIIFFKIVLGTIKLPF